jgi:hypothetical protein
MVESSIYVPPRLPDGTTTDCKKAYPDAALPAGGYVTALTAIAYLASGAEWFAAATKVHERTEHATRDSHFAAGVWREVETNLHHYFPMTIGMLAGMDQLRQLLEAASIDGIAKPIGSDRSERIEPFQFADWRRTWEREGGLILIPGYWDLKVDVAQLRRAAPPPARPAERPHGTKFHNMAEKFHPIFERHYERWSAVFDDGRRSRSIRAALTASPQWKDGPPDVKTIKRHWDYFVSRRN